MLDKIITDTKRAVEIAKSKIDSSVMNRALSFVTYEPIDVLKLFKSAGIHIIAEYKRRSPSRGKISGSPLSDVISEYEKGGASAISILTNGAFEGTIGDLEETRQLTKLPILRKEFIIDEYQLFQSKAYGADFVLLIARILSDIQLKDFLDITDYLGIKALVETESAGDVERALNAGAKLIGVNNRDLKSFTVEKAKGLMIAKTIPSNIAVVIESGIAVRSDMDPFIDAGLHNFLVGTSLMLSYDKINSLNNLLMRDSSIDSGNSAI